MFNFGFLRRIQYKKVCYLHELYRKIQIFRVQTFQNYLILQCIHSIVIKALLSNKKEDSKNFNIHKEKQILTTEFNNINLRNVW
jgi:hypothetical protein